MHLCISMHHIIMHIKMNIVFVDIRGIDKYDCRVDEAS